MKIRNTIVSNGSYFPVAVTLTQNHFDEQVSFIQGRGFAYGDPAIIRLGIEYAREMFDVVRPYGRIPIETPLPGDAGRGSVTVETSCSASFTFGSGDVVVIDRDDLDALESALEPFAD